MITSDILSKLNLTELIDTKFEDFITIKKFTEGDVLLDILHNKLGACYIVKGQVELISYTIDGKEFYRYFFPGDIIGIGECFIDKNKNELETKFGMDMHILENSEIAYLPFFELISLKIEKKDEILRKLIVMTTKEKYRESSHYLGKALYSDEEFIVKALEHLKTIKTSNTKKLAKGLNMNLRNLQRLLKKLEKMDIVTKNRGIVSIKDFKKFNEYKKYLEKKM
ncbi:hypothetical protein NRK67_13875 [Fusobacteria bacterium ZRK30]|nr:hypothetical protein NRK67_13875 [Fusobacteria bacterium ZRK30]